MSKKTKKSAVVSRKAFDRAIADIYRERTKLAELKESTVTRERFDNAINDIRRLRSQVAAAYRTGANQVLSSEPITEFVPKGERQRLQWRFAKRAHRSGGRNLV